MGGTEGNEANRIGLEAQDAFQQTERVRKEVQDSFLRLKEELERARELLRAHATLAEESLGHVMPFEALKRRCEELRQVDRCLAVRPVPLPPFPADGTVDPQMF